MADLTRSEPRLPKVTSEVLALKESIPLLKAISKTPAASLREVEIITFELANGLVPESIYWPAYNNIIPGIIGAIPAREARILIGAQVLEICELLGVSDKALPSDNAAKRIAEWFCDQYQGWHVLELYWAFWLALRDHISVDLSHFQSFNILYLKKVMDAYKPWRKKSLAASNRWVNVKSNYEALLSETAQRREASSQAIMNQVLMFWDAFIEPNEPMSEWLEEIVLRSVSALGYWLVVCKAIPNCSPNYIQKIDRKVKASLVMKLRNQGKKGRLILRDTEKLKALFERDLDKRICLNYLMALKSKNVKRDELLGLTWAKAWPCSPTLFRDVLQSQAYRDYQKLIALGLR